jgi:hypothetical protein
MLQPSLIYANIQGLYPASYSAKVSYLRDLVSSSYSGIKIIALTESHLHPDVLDAEIALPGFLSFRSDRDSRSHGGVITYVSDHLSCNLLLSYSDRYCSVSVIHLTDLKSVLINLYRPPDCPSQSFEGLIEVIRTAVESVGTPVPDIVFVGDLNFPRFSWPDGKLLPRGTRMEQQQARRLIDLSSDLSLTQCILKPTRNESILDLVFTNNSDLLLHYDVVPTIFSDHNFINLYLNLKSIYPSDLPPPPPLMASFDFLHADWDHVIQDLKSHNWDDLISNAAPQEQVNIFMEKIEETCRRTLRLRAGLSKKKRIVPRAYRILFRKRSRIVKQISLTNSPHRTHQLLERLHSIESELQTSYKLDRRKEEQEAVKVIKKNPKFFYKYARKHSQTKSEIGPLLNQDGVPVHSSTQMSEMFRNQFDSVYSTPVPEKIVANPGNFFSASHLNPPYPSLTDIDFSIEDVIKAIDQLKIDSAPGPDAIPAVFLKKCKTELSLPIFMIWRKSLDLGTIPDMLKSATVIPIHKGDSRAVPSNYRPISLTSHITKLLERIIRERLVTYLESNNLMNDNQHGFRPGRSCLTQLLEHYDAILEGLEKGANVDVIYLDFAKAFDKVDHGILCHKLRSMGIRGRLGGWLHSFLHDRSQKVSVNFSKSSYSRVISGVPQGTVLGPILFLIHIADINDNIESHVSSFADDTRVSKHICSMSNVNELQSDLQLIYEWQKVNNMLFNDKKFEVLRYGKNSVLTSVSNYYSPTGSVINAKDSVRDLGIIMSNQATFDDHLNHVVLKVRKVTGWILRTFVTRDASTMLTLWTSLVQPHIDYCSQLWAPYKLGAKMALEAPQRSFTRQIEGMVSLNYWDRLKALNIYSQERRMERYKIIYTWKALEGLTPNFGVTQYTSIRHGRLCRLPHVKTGSPLSIQSLREGSLLVQGPKLFNRVPKSTRNLTGCSVAVFKYSLDQSLQRTTDNPRCPNYGGDVGQCNSLLRRTMFDKGGGATLTPAV